MNSKQLTYVRTTASIILTLLTALLAVYPNETWTPFIATALAVGGILGIHAIPSVSQKGNTMSTGPELMGIVPVHTGERVAPVDPQPVAEPVAPESTIDLVMNSVAPQLGVTFASDPKEAVRQAVKMLLAAIENL